MTKEELALTIVERLKKNIRTWAVPWITMRHGSFS